MCFLLYVVLNQAKGHPSHITQTSKVLLYLLTQIFVVILGTLILFDLFYV